MDNILVSGGNSVVIDWMTACGGAPSADVCRFFHIFNINALPPGVLFSIGIMLDLFRKYFGCLYLKEYMRASGLKKDQILAWQLPIAADRLWIQEKGEEVQLRKIIKKELERLETTS